VMMLELKTQSVRNITYQI